MPYTAFDSTEILYSLIAYNLRSDTWITGTNTNMLFRAEWFVILPVLSLVLLTAHVYIKEAINVSVLNIRHYHRVIALL